MALVLALVLVVLLGLTSASSAQDIDLVDLFASGGSPTGMLFELLGDTDNYRVRDVLQQIPLAMLTQSDEFKQTSATVAETAGFDCNLTGVDPACFLEEFAGHVGAPWKTREIDTQKAADLVTRFLQPHGLTMSGAIALCIISPAAMPFLTDTETSGISAASVINEAKTACRKSV
ncbi:hypothetical protein TGME49_233360 [Toxoplasma gondii ME49]|uniref:Uncharacterized protein n=4 Tax=Toxoplasma gondii TaxID=5811 RepID=B6KK22_TOXGV|nr:hypothetical protein TGME49_233360 [Toxoplasma gondii ME49]ESS35848.1 hypothetical protein TGVEG_233360 [Toxoplasma gondii VEG]KYF46317.1 hypothetical protein TGARI_233360 [Toxoplasma gondii ARI]PIM04165.1 hypothetical protein TGCOUG_233360 [Toxoplasma gondii COUG]EPT28772.1 hypothetical protein TGME49_233360 [Toxoplasma gondii ME49]CEL74999.1 TPA: hypothetical protein BN1205_022190 [Toxoplasma gondii VEG]|eukprot:XP_002368195.1 hypothetical protein TGME49_233360 [Toxoplasma gondii ME49]